MFDWKRVFKLISYLVAYIYLVFGYINEIMPDRLNGVEWYKVVGYIIVLILVFGLPLMFVADKLEKD